MSRAPQFPLLVKIGSVAVRIYRQVRPAEPDRNRAEREFFSVAWHDAGGARQVRQFADLSKAKEEARMKAEALAAGRSEAAASLSMDDVALISEVRRLAGNTPPLAAMAEWVAAKALCGEHLLTAARAWADANGAKKSATVSEVIGEFLAVKRRAGVAMKSYDAYVKPLVEDMGDAPMTTVAAEALSEWAHERFGDEETELAHPGTFNTVRKRLVTAWKWARDKGLLPNAAKTQADLIEPMREDAHQIGIFTIETFTSILALVRAEHPEFLAVPVLAGFAGLRRSEIHAQSWEDIDLKRGLLRVTKAKKGTVAYRLVHLCPAAVEWLALCVRQETEETADGRKITPISPPWGIDRVRSFVRDAKLPCPENGFRHSFVSYRCAATGNVNETAQEAGNSASVVFKHYRELVAKEEGIAWFAVTPPPLP